MGKLADQHRRVSKKKRCNWAEEGNSSIQDNNSLKTVSQGKIQDFMSISVFSRTWNVGVE